MRSPSSLSVRRLVAGGVGVAMTAALTFAGAVSAQAADTSCVSGVCTVTFAYSGAAEQWVVPSGVTSVTATISAGSGGKSAPSSGSDATEAGVGGLGGSMRATLPVKAGQKLVAIVGSAGQDGVTNSKTPAAGGYGGGAAAGSMVNAPNHGSGGGGGGGSFLFGPSSLLLGTGGGGGGAITALADTPGVNGGAGGSSGAGSPGKAPQSDTSWTYSGGGGTASGPGAGGSGALAGAPGSSTPTSSPTAFGVGGHGADNSSTWNYNSAGGGGGGFYGGGGGASDDLGGLVGAGGGGSGFVVSNATDVVALSGNLGNGSIVLTYDEPKAATTTGLKTSDNPNNATATTLTATVTPATATGNVSFLDGTTDLGAATLTNGTATLAKSLSAGTHTITATYSGDASHTSSSATTTVTVTAYTAPTFDVTSTSDAPITKRVVAGEAFSFDFTASGTPTPTYSIENDDTDSTVLPDGVTFTNGILAGSSTRAGTWKIKVTATNSLGTATEYVKLTIAPGTATALEAAVSPGGSSSTTLWAVAPDGTVTEPSNGTASTTITANQGDSIVFDTMPVDQYGNPTTRANVQPVTTSSIDTDTISYDPATNLTTVTFNHASPHVITFTIGGLTNSFAVQVTPTPTPSTGTGATTSTSTGTPASSSGSTSTSNHLAITGSAPLAPLGWALCILAAGVAVMLLQRHRTTRRPN